ncbi:MAG: hypothetical protein KC800_34705, partial [Candidatus Eremiobacteraeota bacterium]|nr:hypothetical protein [Candidatus Eremiobacteraeota bacterium]
MEHPTELDHFLTEHEGERSYACQESAALARLAEQHLPFPAAWAVKLVQCAVREGAVASVQVELTSR